jgi:hypothetical protein
MRSREGGGCVVDVRACVVDRPRTDQARTHGQQLAALCRGELGDLTGPPGWGWTCLGVVIAAAALYGATVGWWQAPQQAVYAAIKFPFLILATVAGNALLNAMLAQVLGVPLTFRQAWLAILMSFVVATLMLAAFAPVSLLLAWSAPSTDQATAWSCSRTSQRLPTPVSRRTCGCGDCCWQ